MNTRFQTVILVTGIVAFAYLYAHYSEVSLGIFGKEDVSGGIFCTFVDTQFELSRKFIHTSKRYNGIHGCPIYILKGRID